MMADPAVANRMSPWAFQVPPRGVLDSSATVCAGPPPAGIRRSRVCVKNARNRLSGDQKGNAALSVPGRAVAVRLSMGRTHSSTFPVASAATKASVLPSGEIVPLFVPSGAPMLDAQDVLSGGAT